MSYVLVINKNKQPVNPCHPGEARKLLSGGKAAVFRSFPFTIILKEDYHKKVRPLRVKFDPGSKKTGVALVDNSTGKVVAIFEIDHRSVPITKTMTSRSSIRRSRRSRKTPFREPRFDNRRRKEDWLPPSVESRVSNTMTLVRKLITFSPVSAISIEHVKFDTQRMQNPEITGVEYQQGELAGYEVREYLLEKFNRTCVYCKAEKVPLEIDHIMPKSRGGTNRVSNLTLSCRPCNQRKGNQTAKEFGHPQVQKMAQAPLKDAAAMNVTRTVLLKRLGSFGLPIETGTGAQTKYNRTQQKLEKAHWIDAACVGASTPKNLIIKDVTVLKIKATGHGSRQMCRVDKFGFPRTGPKKGKIQRGFQTGDSVKAVVKMGKHKGTHKGRVAVRSSGSFNITTQTGVVQGIKHSDCKLIHRCDGYSYNYIPALPHRSKERRFRADRER